MTQEKKINYGKLFENDIKKSVPDDFYYLRLKDSAGFGSSSDKNVRFTSHNPFDALLQGLWTLFTLELKSSEGTSFSFSQEPKKSAMIKYHQIIGLQEAGKHKGVVSGFLLNFRKTKHTYFLYIQDFIRFQDATDKKSLNEADVILNGGIIIDQRLLKTNYRYDILKLCQRLSEEERNAKSNV